MVGTPPELSQSWRGSFPTDAGLRLPKRVVLVTNGHNSQLAPKLQRKQHRHNHVRQ